MIEALCGVTVYIWKEYWGKKTGEWVRIGPEMNDETTYVYGKTKVTEMRFQA